MVSLQQVPAASIWRPRLEIALASEVYELCRLRLVDDVPISVQTAYLSAALCPRLEENDLTASLYRLLESRYGLRLWSGRETLRARRATEHDSCRTSRKARR